MLYQKPDDNEIEISIFGPGYGECIVIHAGFNDWMIVDSCIDQFKRPAGLEYLDKLGVDVEHDVKIVVATHWHDDHIRGLSDVVQSCKNALFVCSSALRFEEFKNLVALCGRKRIDQNSGSGVKEFFQILTTIRERIESISPPEPLSWAISGRCLWKSLDRDPQHKFEVFSLSPNDFSVTMSKVEIAKILPQSGDNDKNIVSISPNHTAVVLWLRLGCDNILLGSDLQESNGGGRGWTTILDSQIRPRGTADIYKVPHHGSKNADNPNVWKEMLVKDTVGVLTPFTRGRSNLPTIGDINRICGRTDKAFITAPSRSMSVRWTGVVERELKESHRNLRRVNRPLGHIRVRKSIDEQGVDKWKIEKFGPARELNGV